MVPNVDFEARAQGLRLMLSEVHVIFFEGLRLIGICFCGVDDALIGRHLIRCEWRQYGFFSQLFWIIFDALELYMCPKPDDFILKALIYLD